MESIPREDFQFMPETSAAEIESLPLSLHLILWVTVVFLAIALIWDAKGQSFTVQKWKDHEKHHAWRQHCGKSKWSHERAAPHPFR